MKKHIALVFGVLFCGTAAHAASMCAPQAIAAAKALAAINGSVAKTAAAESDAGQVYTVTLSDAEGEDYYWVETSGGHDCTVYSVKINGEPTPYP